MSHDITKSIPRPDGRAKAAGEALYVADLPRDGMLTGRFLRSSAARGRIREVVVPELPDGYFVIGPDDVPGENVIPLAASRDWPCFAHHEVRYVGQIVRLIAGPDPVTVDRIHGECRVVVDETVPAIDIDQALAFKGGPIHGEDNVFCRVDLDRGDVDAAFASAERVVEGTYDTGFQEQLYMEPQGLIAIPEGARVTIRGSMQCPYYVHHAVSHVLGSDHDAVRIVQDTVGGGFGGKEDYPEIMGAPMAVAAKMIGKPIRMIMDRVEDLAYTSKRHPSRCRYRTALDADANILAMDVVVDLDGGAYESYTKIVLMRAVFSALGVYNLPAFRIRGRGIATNTVPSGAFRGFGAPQSLYALELHMEEIARIVGVEVLEYKRRFFLTRGDSTVTGGTIRDEVILDALIERVETMSEYSWKRSSYGAMAASQRDDGSAYRPDSSPLKGIGMAFIYHGCGFTGDGEQKIIKAKAALRKRSDDRVEILCAAVDFGQGPQTTLRKVVGRVLGIPADQILFDFPDTDLVPDSGPTVASRTMMVVGYLLQKAAEELKEIWKPGEEQMVERRYEMPPGMSWDQESLTGDAYATFGWGVNVVEVEVDPCTWEIAVTGAWAVFDVGRAVDERVVNGQIQGGMSQALGYGAMEKLEIGPDGAFRQITFADYMVPTSVDFPPTGADTVDNPYEYGAFGAKGMGEMVHNGGHTAFAAAVEQAVGRPCPKIPLTPETLLEVMS